MGCGAAEPGTGPLSVAGRTVGGMNGYGVGGVPTVEWGVVESGIGPLLLAATSAGLVGVAFHARPAVREAALAQLRPGSARSRWRRPARHGWPSR
ncbi:hypothetical protein SMICM304S_06242 [Streptomyces microflavus]